MKQWIVSAALVVVFFVVAFSVTLFIMLFPIVGLATMLLALFVVAVVGVRIIVFNSGGDND